MNRHQKTAIAMAVLSLIANNSQAEDAPDIPSISVYASRFEEKAADALPQTTIISADEIEKSGVSNVSEVLSKVAGLPTKINLDGSTNAVIDLRGYGDTADNNTVILLDGIRLSENEQATARTSMIPLEVIDHIEITKGGNSVLYGDGATSGTINIITKKNAGDLSVVTAGISSYSGRQASLFHSMDLGVNQMSLFAKTDATNGYRQNSKTTEESAGLNWAANFNATDRIGARIIVNKEMDHLPGALPLVYLNTSPQNSEVPGYQNSMNTNTNSVTLFGNKKIGNVEFLLDLSQRIKNFDWAYNYDAHAVSTSYTQPNPYSTGQESSLTTNQTVNPRIKINDLGLPGNSLILGYDWNKTERILNAFLTFGTGASGPSSSALNYRSQGWYVRDDWQFTALDRITLGFRNHTYTENENPIGSATPWNNSNRASAYELEYSRKLGASSTGYIRAGQNFRLPNIDDNYKSAYYGQAPSYTPIQLVPQTSHDIDFGLVTKTKIWDSEIRYFRSDITHEIGYDPSQGDLNFDPTRREGIELKEYLKLCEHWDTKLNLQVIRATFSSGQYSGNTIPSTSKVNGNLTLDYLINAHQQVGLTTRFSSEKYASGDYLNNQAKVPGYAVLDLTYGYREKNWSLVGSANNIFDKHYADIGIYYPMYYIPPYNLTTYPNPGRNFSLVGRYSF